MNEKTISIIIKAQDKASQVIESAGGKIKSALSKAATFAKTAGLTIGAAITAAIGKFVVAGGISRALNIEDAQAKLKGLGHDTKSVQDIMNSALASVKGTAYGLDEAATTAASAVAAGIEPGQELTKYLKTTADAATIAGTSMGDMGSIINKVTTGGYALTDNLNQLADRGIPIFQWLQKEYGVSADKLREMVSDGKVDAATFREVIAKNIGGAALASGATTRGAWDNMKAAMARVGEAITKDIIPKVRDAFGSMTNWFDNNSDKIVAAVSKGAQVLKDFAGGVIDLGRQIAAYLSPKLKDLLGAIENIMPTLKEFLFAYIIPMAAAIGKTLVFALGLAIDALRILVNVLKPVIGWLNDNRSAVMGLAAALATLKGALMLKSAISAVSMAIGTMKMGFVAQTIATVGLRGALGAASTALVGAAAAIGPVGWAAIVASAAVGGLVYWMNRNNDSSSQWDLLLQRVKLSEDQLAAAHDRLREAQRLLSDSQLTQEGSALAVERAQRTYNDTLAQYGPKSLEAREAAHNLKVAQQQLKDDVVDTTNKINLQNEALSALQRNTPLVVKAASDIANQVRIIGDVAKDASIQIGNVISAGTSRKVVIAAQNLRDVKVGGGVSGSYAVGGGGKMPGYATGGFTGRGDKNDIAGIVHKGEYVMPSDMVDQQTGTPKGSGGNGNSTFNMYGNIQLGSAGAVDRFFTRLNTQQEMGNLGVGV